MTIIELANMANEKNLMELITVKGYVPFVQKQEMLLDVLESSIKVEDGYTMIDSLKEYFEFTLQVIELYTNIDFSKDQAMRVAEYDVLCQSGLAKMLVSAIGDEYNDCLTFLKMLERDIDKRNCVKASVARLAENIGVNLDLIIGILANKVKEIDIEKLFPNGIDLGEILKNFKG